jgi:hypothetical protein
MSKKQSKDTGAKKCTCNKCLLEAHSIPGTYHRRCSGNSENNTPRPKSDYIPAAERGKWEVG